MGKNHCDPGHLYRFLCISLIATTNFNGSNPHYTDVIMTEGASQITSLTIVYSAVYSGRDQRKHQSSASLAFVRGIHRRPVNSPHKGPVTRKMFPFDDVIMRRLAGARQPQSNHLSGLMMSYRLVNTTLCNVLLLDGTKPLCELMLTYHCWCLVTCIWEHLHGFMLDYGWVITTHIKLWI